MKRLLWTVIVALVLGAAALWGAGRLVWSQEQQELTWPTPLALLVLASIGAMFAVRPVGKRVLGGVLVVAGGAACVLAVTDVELFGMGPVIALLGGLLTGAAGGLLMARGHRLPGMGSRYETPAAQRAKQQESGGGHDEGDGEQAGGRTGTAADDGDDLWTALSEGKDPTEEG